MRLSPAIAAELLADSNFSDGVMALQLCASKVHHVRKLDRLYKVANLKSS